VGTRKGGYLTTFSWTEESVTDTIQKSAGAPTENYLDKKNATNGQIIVESVKEENGSRKNRKKGGDRGNTTENTGMGNPYQPQKRNLSEGGNV